MLREYRLMLGANNNRHCLVISTGFVSFRVAASVGFVSSPTVAAVL